MSSSKQGWKKQVAANITELQSNRIGRRLNAAGVLAQFGPKAQSALPFLRQALDETEHSNHDPFLRVMLAFAIRSIELRPLGETSTI